MGSKARGLALPGVDSAAATNVDLSRIVRPLGNSDVNLPRSIRLGEAVYSTLCPECPESKAGVRPAGTPNAEPFAF